MKSWWSVLLLLIIPFLTVYSKPQILVHPQSTTALDGSTAIFNCTASYSDYIYFRKDTRVIERPDQGFVQGPSKRIHGSAPKMVYRKLTVSVRSSFNNTEIQCVAFDSSNGPLVYSHTAILTVPERSKLPSVVDMSYCFIDLFTVNISWSQLITPPDTYKVIGYNVSVTSYDITTNYFTFTSYYALLLIPVMSNKLVIKVSGYNGIDGNSAKMLVIPSEVLTAPVSTLRYDRKNQVLELSVNINVRADSSDRKEIFAINVSSYSGSHYLLNLKIQTKLR